VTTACPATARARQASFARPAADAVEEILQRSADAGS
jgi:hypothetical protein